MIKLYKNLTEKYMKFNFYGIGEVVIPAGAKAIPLDTSVVDIIQAMTPIKIFEEVEEVAKEELVFTETEEEKPLEEEEKPLEEITNAVLRDMCKEKGIECSEKDTKPILIAKLRGE